MNKILVPTDLTAVAGLAIRQAEIIAKKSNAQITLLHVLDEKSPSLTTVEMQLKEEVAKVDTATGIVCDFLVQKGNLFEVIPGVSCDKCYDLMVIGTHGIHGIRQMFFGANILKLVMKTPMPVLVLQEEAQVVTEFKKLVFPVSSHESIQSEIDAAMLFAGIFDTEIHLYSIHKAGFEWPEQLIRNIDIATHAFESRGVQLKRIKEDQNVYSPGYAKQTLKYAKSVKADFISMMAVASKEYYYFAQTDKESMLFNDQHLPILCTSGHVREP